MPWNRARAAPGSAPRSGAALVGVVLFARRRRAGPAVAGAIAGLAILVTLAALGGARSGDQQFIDCYARFPAAEQESIGIDIHGWSIVDGGSVAVWRRGDRTGRMTC